jgi:hypothetical protein
MGGAHSQKLLPRRGFVLLSGAQQTSGLLQNPHCSPCAGRRTRLPIPFPAPLFQGEIGATARRGEVGGLGHFCKAEASALGRVGESIEIFVNADIIGNRTDRIFQTTPRFFRLGGRYCGVVSSHEAGTPPECTTPAISPPAALVVSRVWLPYGSYS